MRAAVVMTVALAGCATLSSSRRQPVHVTSAQPGAAVFVDGAQVAFTPTTLVVRVDAPPDITIVAPDGRRHVCAGAATPNVGYVVIQSLAVPLWVGLVVDTWTAAWNEVDPRCTAPW